MKTSFIFVTSFIIALSNLSFAQEKHTFYGTISSNKNGEKLIGASVYDTLHKIGATTNEYGFYSLTVPDDKAPLQFSSFGFETILIQADQSMKEINVSLTEINSLEEVKVSVTKKSTESTNLGTIELPLEKVDKLPVLMGEKDVLKILQLMPGVKSGGEGSSGIYVRGGGPDQNLILLDGVPVYNASHLFGFFSVFNSDALSQVSLTKGGFPARYGGRVSSVLDMRMKEGNSKKFNTEGSIGVIASRILVEGPIKKDKGAFILSARRTYLDALIYPFLPKENRGGYYFYDLNTKLNYKLDDKHHIYWSAYSGKDRAYFTTSDESMLDDQTSISKTNSELFWGNVISALRWNYKIGPKLFKNTTLTYSKYKFNVGMKMYDQYNFNGNETSTNEVSFNYFSGINDWSVKSDFTYIPTPNTNIKFGFSEIYHTFKPGVNTFKATSNEETLINEQIGSKFIYSHEFMTYIENDHKLSDRLKINYGVNNILFILKNRTNNKIQPRISGNYIINDFSSFKFGYARTAQFLHLLTNAGLGLPTDLWVPATDSIPPVVADQISLGYNIELGKKYNFTIESYYKKMNNLIQYKEGASFFGQNSDWQKKVEIGQGWAYGVELFAQKKIGKLTGWIGYTLSWTERQFDNINFGEKFYYKYDRRHDVSVVATYELNDTWDFGFVFVYGTGNAITLPTQSYDVAPNYMNNFNSYFNSNTQYTSAINNYRMPAYHRADISINRTREKSWGSTVLSFSIYNVYNRMNAYYLYTDTENGKNRLMQISIFPIIPSINWVFKIDYSKIKINRNEK